MPQHTHLHQSLPTDAATGRQEPWTIQTVAAQVESSHVSSPQ